MRHVILGAGPLGFSLAGLLRDSGTDFDLYSIMGQAAYDMPGTTPDHVDGASPDVLERMCRDADVTYLLLNAHYIDWHHLYTPRVEAAISAAESTGTRLIYHDNLYMYGPRSGPLTESTAQDSPSRKGQLRSELAQKVLDAVKTGRIRGTIGRSADMYGPGALNSSFNSTLGQRHFFPLLADRPVSVLGNADIPHTYAYVEDVARGLMTLGTNVQGDGDVWHLPAAETLTHRQLLGIAFEVANKKARVRASALSPVFVRMIGRFQADVGEVSEMLYQFQKPLAASHDKFRDRFGEDVTPHDEAMKTTLEWYRRNIQFA